MTSRMVQAAFLLIVAATAGAPATVAAGMRDRTLVIGKVTENPKKHYHTLKPIADYVASHMTDLGIERAEVLMARDNRQMIAYLRRKKIDWVTETVFSSILFQEKAGAEFLLRKWKKGVAEYHTILFARKDSGIQHLSDLRGKTMAFEDPGSTSAYFIPASVLIRQGLRLVRLASYREKPPADTVGYVFSGQERNTAVWVHKGLVDAGAFNNLDWEKSDVVGNRLRSDLILFYRTKAFPRALELVRKELNQKVKLRLKKVLLRADRDPSARQALAAYQKTKKFDKIGKTVREGIDAARGLLKIVNTRLKVTSQKVPGVKRQQTIKFENG